jgi:hypothetical protein
MSFTGKADDGLIMVHYFPSLRGVTTDTDKIKRDRLIFPSFSGTLLHEGVTAQPHTVLIFEVDIIHRKLIILMRKKGDSKA